MRKLFKMQMTHSVQENKNSTLIVRQVKVDKKSKYYVIKVVQVI